MTFEQLLAEVAAQPTQAKAFQVLVDCLKIEMTDAAMGNTPPPSLQAKYDEILGTASNKANDLLHAIEDGKPALEPLPVRDTPAYDPTGPMSPTAQPKVFVDKPVATPAPVVNDAPPASPFSSAHEPLPSDQTTNVVREPFVSTTTPGVVGPAPTNPQPPEPIPEHAA